MKAQGNREAVVPAPANGYSDLLGEVSGLLEQARRAVENQVRERGAAYVAGRRRPRT